MHYPRWKTSLAVVMVRPGVPVDVSVLMWIWVVAGIAMIASEAVLPGMITGFLGAGALVAAALVKLGLVETVEGSAFAWMISSSVFVVTLRRALLRRFPSSSSHEPPLDDAALMGTVVDVVAAIDEDSDAGRIRLHGTSWPARASTGRIAAGSRAKLVFRDNMVWTVEPIDQLEQPTELVPTEKTNT